MKTHEFKIGAVYSPDGGETTILIAAPTLGQLARAWKRATMIKMNHDMLVRIDGIEGENVKTEKKL